ncbi:MAG TPA: hypothetical protein VFJ14_06795 [Nocardioidaceae bacterium]|nr:hypothetical protein [Nocardioidaceae bacterium]
MSDTVDQLARAIGCPYCGAQPGQRCRASGGHGATYSHSARAEPIRIAWIDGFHEGQVDIIGAIDSGFTAYVDARRREMRRADQ